MQRDNLEPGTALPANTSVSTAAAPPAYTPANVTAIPSTITTTEYQPIYPSLHILTGNAQALYMTAPQAPISMQPPIQVMRTADDYFELSVEEQAKMINIQPMSPARLFYNAPSQLPAVTARHISSPVKADGNEVKPELGVKFKIALMIRQ